MRQLYTAVGLGAIFCLAACSGENKPAGGITKETTQETTKETPTTEETAKAGAFTPEILPIPETPKGFEPMPVPEDNALTPEKVALGRQLFFDKRLSADGSVSCYSCHVCENGLTDGKPVAEGALGKKLTRSSPTLWNIGYHTNWYWDGRSDSMEKQAMAAWTGANMSGNAEEVAKTLNGIEGYKEQFQKVFGSEATPENIVQAITSFERAALVCGDTPFDKWQAGDQNAVGEDVKRGWEIFRGKAGCGTCHAGALFTDLQFHNIGIGMDAEDPDVGRFKVTNDEKDKGAFKTPTLRDISRSAPYFHDGSAATLEEAVDIMLAGGKPNPNLDKQLQKVELTPEEKADLIAFLKSLDCPCDLPEPKLPGM